jgi:MFS family permease
MALTILFYSVFSGITAFATEVWHVGALRFLVAMGVGGEWAVGAALVAEVFPKQARERAGGIFHATSVAGLWLAAAAGLMVGTQWRSAYLLGIIPALLVLWVRISIKEPQAWKEAKENKPECMGSFTELLGSARWRSRAVFGALLAMVGLATFWGVVIAGQDLAADLLKRLGDPDWSQALVIHETPNCGSVPNDDMWICQQTMIPWLEKIWAMDQYLHHGWWEQAALVDLMGYDPTIANFPTYSTTNICAFTLPIYAAIKKPNKSTV